MWNQRNMKKNPCGTQVGFKNNSEIIHFLVNSHLLAAREISDYWQNFQVINVSDQNFDTSTFLVGSSLVSNKGFVIIW